MLSIFSFGEDVKFLMSLLWFKNLNWAGFGEYLLRLMIIFKRCLKNSRTLNLRWEQHCVDRFILVAMHYFADTVQSLLARFSFLVASSLLSFQKFSQQHWPKQIEPLIGAPCILLLNHWYGYFSKIDKLESIANSLSFRAIAIRPKPLVVRYCTVLGVQ